MDSEELFSDSAYNREMQMAEDELSAFLKAVKELYGPEEANLSAEDWLDESDLIDSPPLSIGRDWRAVTIAASARLAHRLSVALCPAPPFGTSRGASTNTKVSPIPSCNCFAVKLVV
ncbi:MAG: hypothetical protein ABSD39_04400 [Terriglobales bacterium]|jgi:hypothetical protein